MESKGTEPTRTPVEDELVRRVAWQIHLRWLAAAGVLILGWFATSLLNIPLPRWALYAVGLAILVYNGLFWIYLKRLEKEPVNEALVFGRFAKVQTSLDWLAMILLVHLSGGVESPLLFYFIFHLILASILLSPAACYFFATTAVLGVGVLAYLEYAGLIPHFSLGIIPVPLYQSGLYVGSILFFFGTSLYISVFLATSVTSNLRTKDETLVRLEEELASAYGRLLTVYEVTKTVSSTLDLDEVWNLIAKSAAEAMRTEACTIGLLDESGQVSEIVASYGLGEVLFPGGPVDFQSKLLTSRTLAGQPTIVPDLHRDEHLPYLPETGSEWIKSMLCVPFVIGDKAEGVICLYSFETDHFSQSDARFLSALAGEGATAIMHARAFQALELADRAKSDFVRMVTHELRSPLSAVQSMLRLLEQGYVGSLTSKQQDLVQRSQRRISFLLALVRDLLDLAAGKMEQLAGEKQEVMLDEIIAKAIRAMKAIAQEKELRLEVQITEEPLALIGSEDGLERVFMNLVSNAVKYTPAGGSVVVKAWSADDEIKVEVSDTGIGIPEEALPRIFAEFYRAKNAKSVEMEGTGLGLAIAKDVLEQHGGQITVKSVLGEGSTFYVTLPKGKV